MSYSNAWRRQAYQQAAVAQPRDPAHNDPEQITPGRNWATAPDNPNLMPRDGVTDQDIYTLDSAGGGLPYTPPDHADGVGYGAGLDFAASAAQNAQARDDGDGSYLPRTWNAMGDRDGEYHVDRDQFDYQTTGPVSPVQVGMQSWTDPTYYPNRRPGHMIKRWRDRVFERKTWQTEFRAVVIPNAYTAPPLAAVANGNQYTSPYPDAVATNVRVVNTTAPQLRRTPAPWDESITQDGTVQPAAGPPDPGFQSWGL